MTDVKEGDLIPEMTFPPISRHTLALYCGASGDHNPVHVDIDFAKQYGLDDVIAHGMLSMAYLGRMLTSWRPQSSLRKFSARFAGMVQVGEIISCHGMVSKIYSGANEEKLAELSIFAKTNDERDVIVGEAIISL